MDGGQRTNKQTRVLKGSQNKLRLRNGEPASLFKKGHHLSGKGLLYCSFVGALRVSLGVAEEFRSVMDLWGLGTAGVLQGWKGKAQTPKTPNPKTTKKSLSLLTDGCSHTSLCLERFYGTRGFFFFGSTTQQGLKLRKSFYASTTLNGTGNLQNFWTGCTYLPSPGARPCSWR